MALLLLHCSITNLVILCVFGRRTLSLALRERWHGFAVTERVVWTCVLWLSANFKITALLQNLHAETCERVFGVGNAFFGRKNAGQRVFKTQRFVFRAGEIVIRQNAYAANAL